MTQRIKKCFLSLSAIATSLFLSSAQSQIVPPTHASVPANLYRDTAYGMSFQYPKGWKRVTDPGGIFGSTAFQTPGVQGSGVPVRAAIEFRAEGTVYADTTLESLSFIYGVITRSTAASCGKVITDVDAVPKRETIRGLVYTHGAGGDAGMSQTLSSQIYSTLQGTRCYVFELDTNQMNGVVRDGQREMTKAEEASLQDSLNNIFVTIRF